MENCIIYSLGLCRLKDYKISHLIGLLASFVSAKSVVPAINTMTYV